MISFPYDENLQLDIKTSTNKGNGYRETPHRTKPHKIDNRTRHQISRRETIQLNSLWKGRSTCHTISFVLAFEKNFAENPCIIWNATKTKQRAMHETWSIGVKCSCRLNELNNASELNKKVLNDNRKLLLPHRTQETMVKMDPNCKPKMLIWTKEF